MTHEEFGRYLGLTMVLKRLVRLLPPEELEKIERRCREVAEGADDGNVSAQVAMDMALVRPHVISTLEDIFNPPGSAV